MVCNKALYDDLYELAQECPYEKGVPVLWARAAFPDSLFFNACESEPDSAGARFGNFSVDDSVSVKDENNTEISVYPNPVSSESFTVEIKNNLGSLHFELYDLFGRRQAIVLLPQIINSIGVPSFAKGLYLYKIIDGKEIIKQARIIFLK